MGKKRTKQADRTGFRELSHPTRTAILTTMETDPEVEWSPSQLAELLHESLGTVSYHVRQLLAAKFIKQVRTQPVRGTLEHFYKLAAGYKFEATGDLPALVVEAALRQATAEQLRAALEEKGAVHV